MKETVPPLMRAVLGRHNITNTTQGEERSIARIINNEEYRPEWDGTNRPTTSKSHADITILIMNEDVPFNDFIQPICLPSLSAEVFGITGYSAGYGRNENSEDNQEIARYTDMKTIDLTTCYANDTISSKVVSNKSFCAQKDDVTLCKGKLIKVFLKI
jgi:hypothetical protein